MTYALGVFKGPKAEVESKLDQVRNIPFFGLEEEVDVAMIKWDIPRGVAFSCLNGGSPIL